MWGSNHVLLASTLIYLSICSRKYQKWLMKFTSKAFNLSCDVSVKSVKFWLDHTKFSLKIYLQIKNAKKLWGQFWGFSSFFGWVKSLIICRKSMCRYHIPSPEATKKIELFLEIDKIICICWKCYLRNMAIKIPFCKLIFQFTPYNYI